MQHFTYNSKMGNKRCKNYAKKYNYIIILDTLILVLIQNL